jgi:teneurin
MHFCPPLSTPQPCWQARSCLSHCSGRGVCSAGHCMCEVGFAGKACTRAVPNACKNNCGGHGVCLRHGICACDFGFHGLGCTSLIEFAHCPLHCSGRGLCDPAGRCVCEAGLAGAACERVKPSTASLEPEPRSRAGTASTAPWSASGARTSVPVVGTIFEASPPRGRAFRLPSRDAKRLVPAHTPCPSHCSGHGSCSRGVCGCHAGFGGVACDVVLSVCAHRLNACRWATSRA